MKKWEMGFREEILFLMEHRLHEEDASFTAHNAWEERQYKIDNNHRGEK